ncbi:MAG: 50S ribosomal protein L23 [Bacteroidetes bacterium]|nr:MAG: 50S ribosomal protein L23 [Bacteroidota bacterium]
MEATQILKRPKLSEKMANIPEKNKGNKERYLFIVDIRANKIQIADAVAKMYGVKIDAVNTINYKGKAKSRYTKGKVVEGRTKAYKKAIVTVKQGEIIDFYAELPN